MKDRRKAVAIVDAYSASNQFGPEIRQRGYKSIHIQSAEQIAQCYKPSYRHEDFDVHFIIDSQDDTAQVSDLAQKLKKLNVACIIAGCELGVMLADTLTEKLGLLSNNTAKSHARRNKFYMAQTLKKAGLRAARSYKSSDNGKILGFTRKSGWPVVVKPLSSAGTDSVFICHCEKEVENACNAIVGRINLLGVRNEQVLVQEFLHGDEYIVNSVRDHGRTIFTKFLKYKKISLDGAAFIYDRDELLSGDGEEEKVLMDYMENVLDALQIQFGPAHAEVKIDANGPVLVEIGARIDGLTNPKLEEKLIGYGQLGLSLDSFLACQARVLDHLPTCYKTDMRAYVVHLISNQKGKMRSIDAEKETTIKNLVSFAGMRIKPASGDTITATRDIFSSPGEVHLVHPDKSVLESDYLKIRNLEQNGLFRLF